jgi:uncharacterized protein YodC (DUF2158 family)
MKRFINVMQCDNYKNTYCAKVLGLFKCKWLDKAGEATCFTNAELDAGNAPTYINAGMEVEDGKEER